MTTQDKNKHICPSCGMVSGEKDHCYSKETTPTTDKDKRHQKFLDKMSVDPKSGCWNWLGSKEKKDWREELYKADFYKAMPPSAQSALQGFISQLREKWGTEIFKTVEKIQDVLTHPNIDGQTPTFHDSYMKNYDLEAIKWLLNSLKKE